MKMRGIGCTSTRWTEPFYLTADSAERVVGRWVVQPVDSAVSHRCLKILARRNYLERDQPGVIAL
jgi:hypothetical protein